MGTLYVIATPIGNLEDATYRAVRCLGEVDALACEDTRRTRVLLERYDVPRPKTVFSYHEHNEEQAARRVVELLDTGATVGLVTNAGYPGVSDPGYRAISSAVEHGHDVVALPGAGAVETALAASGLPAVSFTFKGFPPKKPGKRRKWLEMDAAAPHTLVFYESPQRTAVLLADALAVYGDRRAAVCIELTKKFERVARGWLADLADEFATAKIKGEVTVVIAGANEKFIRRPEA
ncbi:MAG: 16S rRNA (cytidine(1402)-2'-O)-methyltransferase [Planctomycetota bacterium]|jgi:16S rRNA (cytidine1402-2'-O)-methyltransferase